MNQWTQMIIVSIFLILIIALVSSGCLKKEQTETVYTNETLDGALPAPTSSGNSVELCLNSRVSYHDGYKGQASDQWLSNVIWAAGEAPITGDQRDIYVTTPYGKYLYDPDTHALSSRTSGRSGDSAFILGSGMWKD